ncbi:MAG: 7-carboxy-7-deazaguanine synthase QueE [Cyanobacteriota bacterium ELA615]|jgi:hypothetical protein
MTISYPIVETFCSIQGEGFWSGTSAFFIRLAGCDVHCSWCDQKETWPLDKHPLFEINDLLYQSLAANAAIVVITGGEPLLHNLKPLTESFKKERIKLHLETSGTHPFSGDFDWVTFSPKTFKIPDNSIYSKADELKVVVANEQDLQWAEAISAKLRNDILKYLQPEWSSTKTIPTILNYIQDNPQWRLSLQMHKFLNIP